MNHQILHSVFTLVVMSSQSDIIKTGTAEILQFLTQEQTANIKKPNVQND